MLCCNCENAVKAAYKRGNPNYRANTNLSIRVHQTLQEFHASIKQGCFICKRVWHDTIERYHKDGIRQPEVRTKADLFNDKIDYQDFETHADDISKWWANRREALGGAKASVTHGTMWIEVTTYDNSPTAYIKRRTTKSPSFSIFTSICEGIRHDFALHKQADNCGPRNGGGGNVLGNSTSAMHSLWRKWLKDCQESHKVCNSGQYSTHFKPSRLVEITQGYLNQEPIMWRLVSAFHEDTVKYVTLSHCWGASRRIELTRSNLIALQASQQSVDVFPQTYRDALNVACMLRYRYIWIDSVCIIQDDLADWREQSSVMGQIYAGSACNIAASSAYDGDQGCYVQRDLDTIAVPKIVCDSLGQGEAEFEIVWKNSYVDNISNAPLNFRGWVVQERCLSPRQLSFGKQLVFWECAELVASEQFCSGLPGLIWSGSVDAPLIEKPRIDHRDDASVRQAWLRMIVLYSASSLSKLTDKTIAFAGLAAAYQRKTDDKYLAGLWLSYIEDDLCWKVARPYRGERSPSTRVSQAPTWSWLSMNYPITPSHEVVAGSPRIRLLRLVSSDIKSQNALNLHTFGLCKITFKAFVAQIDIEDLKRERSVYQGPRILRVNGSLFGFSGFNLCFDTGSGSSDTDANYLDELSAHNGPSLLIVIAQIFYKTSMDQNIFGLVVAPSRAGDDVYTRIGTIEIDDNHALLKHTFDKLNIDFAEKPNCIDLDDTRIVDCVRTITIV